MELSKEDLEQIKKVRVNKISKMKDGRCVVEGFFHDYGDDSVGINSGEAYWSIKTSWELDEDSVKFLKWLLRVWFREDAIGGIMDEVDCADEIKFYEKMSKEVNSDV